jgi:phosphoglucomutase
LLDLNIRAVVLLRRYSRAGFKVYLFEKLAATPLVPYAVLLKKAAAGVMITASHNPKDDNGYKVTTAAAAATKLVALARCVWRASL